jgi:hypothetical protein
MNSKNLVFIFILIINLKFCLNASLSDEYDFENEDNLDLKGEYESNNKFEDSSENEDLNLKDILYVQRRKNPEKTQKLQDRLRGAWNTGFRKRVFSLPDFQFEKRSKSKSFMEAGYGKRGKLPFETYNFGKRLNKQQHSDLEF